MFQRSKAFIRFQVAPNITEESADNQQEGGTAFDKLIFIFLSGHFYRSSRSQMFFKIGVLKNFAIFTGNRFIIKRLAIS